MLTAEQRRKIDAELSTHEVEGEREPVLRRDLEPVFGSWTLFGSPAEIRLNAGGMGGTSGWVEDRRAVLYQPRRSWLEERAWDPTMREMYLSLWAELDDEAMTMARENLQAQLEKARN